MALSRSVVLGGILQPICSFSLLSAHLGIMDVLHMDRLITLQRTTSTFQKFIMKVPYE